MSKVIHLLALSFVSIVLASCAMDPPSATTRKPDIVIEPIKETPGDFVLCNNGQILVFPKNQPTPCPGASPNQSR